MKTKKGFTLIELLIVIAIIGILSAALLPTILNAPARGRDAARVGNLNSIIAGLEAYNSDHGEYPDTPAAGCVGDIPDFGTYFSGGTVPTDPSGTRTLDAAVPNPAGCVAGGEYYYRFVGTTAAQYILATVMENPNANNSDPTDLTSDDEFPACEADCTAYVVVK